MKGFSVYIGFLLLLAFVVYMTKTANRYETKNRIENIVISNNKIIPTEYLLKYINVDSKEKLRLLTPEIILDRIEKHPFILHAEGHYVDSITYSINITEVQPFAILIINKNYFVFTEDKQILPLLPQIQNIDLPLITITNFNGDVKKGLQSDTILNNLFTSLMNIRDVDNGLFNVLSEMVIDSENGNLICYLSKPKGKIIFKRNIDKLQAFYFSSFWRRVILNNEFDNYHYIDFRFVNQIVTKKL